VVSFIESLGNKEWENAPIYRRNAGASPAPPVKQLNNKNTKREGAV